MMSPVRRYSYVGNSKSKIFHKRASLVTEGNGNIEIDRSRVMDIAI